VVSQSELQTFLEELYPELLDRVQESQDVLEGLAKFLSDDLPLTRERLQKPDELPETDQDVRDAGEEIKPSVIGLIPEFESVYKSIKELELTDSGGELTDSGGELTDSGGELTDSGGELTDSGGELTDYTPEKSTIESAYNEYESAHNDLVAHLRETVVVNGISRQDDILNEFSDTSNDLSQRPQQAREFKEGEIPETLKSTALNLISTLDSQINSTISSWQSVIESVYNEYESAYNGGESTDHTSEKST